MAVNSYLATQSTTIMPASSDLKLSLSMPKPLVPSSDALPDAISDSQSLLLESKKPPTEDYSPQPNGADHVPIPDPSSTSQTPDESNPSLPVEISASKPKSPSTSSTSSLSSLSSSSPEASPEFLLRQRLNGTLKEVPSDDSEAETDKLDAGELQEETRQLSLHLKHIEDIPRALSENTLLVKSPTTNRKRRHSQGSESSKRFKVTLEETAKPVLHIESASDVDENKTVATVEEAVQVLRKEAISCLTEIEVEFAKLRDRIHADKMARFVAEIEMCAEGTHPELESFYDQIQTLRDAKIRRAEQKRKYARVCIDNQTRAARDQLHQQFLKDQADARSTLLLQTTEEWYRVNRERRVMDALVPDFGYRTSSDPSILAQERAALDFEVKNLDEISKHIGFPAAPPIKSGTEDEVEEDLQMLGIIGYTSSPAYHLQYRHHH